MTSVRVGLFPPVDQSGGGSEPLQATLARVAEAGVDHLCVGDHVSFLVGAGRCGEPGVVDELSSSHALVVGR